MKKIRYYISFAVMLFLSGCAKDETTLLKGEITFDEVSLNGINLLALPNGTILDPTDGFSLAANIGRERTLTLELSNTANAQNEPWGYTELEGWNLQAFDAVHQTQTLSANQGSPDVMIMIQDQVTMQIKATDESDSVLFVKNIFFEL